MKKPDSIPSKRHLPAVCVCLAFVIAAAALFLQRNTAPVLRSYHEEIALIIIEKESSRGEVWQKKTSDSSQMDEIVKKPETACYKIGEPTPEDALGGDLLTVTIRYRDESKQVVEILPRANGMIYTTPGHETGKSYVGQWPEAESFWDSVAAPAEKIDFIVPLLPEEDPEAASILLYANDPWHGYRKKEVTEPDAIRDALALLSTASYSRKSDTASVSEAWRLTVALRYDNGGQHTVPLVISKQPDTIYVQNPSGRYFVGTWSETGTFWDSIASPAVEISKEEWDAVHTFG